MIQKKILINKWKISLGIKKAAKWIDKNYEGRVPLLIGVLKGAMPFFGHLITKIKTDVEIDFISLSSYEGMITQQKDPEISKFNFEIKGKDIILIEDIVDTGKSMKLLKEKLLSLGAKSIKVVCLVDKPENRKVEFIVDYFCFEVDKDKFLIGFGLDYDEKYRNLPYLAEFISK